MLTLLRLKKSGLPLSEAIALSFYFRAPGRSQRDVRRITNWSTTQASQVVARLCHKGLLAEKEILLENSKARLKTYHPTKKGAELAGHLGGLFGDVESFNMKFGHARPAEPRALTGDLKTQAVTHLKEELKEYLDTPDDDLENKFDALVDLVYVALGAAHHHGFPFEEGWNRVHKKNMTKQRAKKGSKSNKGRPSSVDIVKPPGFVPASLADLVTPTRKQAL